LTDWVLAGASAGSIFDSNKGINLHKNKYYEKDKRYGQQSQERRNPKKKVIRSGRCSAGQKRCGQC
jgi:hypothetical protein